MSRLKASYIVSTSLVLYSIVTEEPPAWNCIWYARRGSPFVPHGKLRELQVPQQKAKKCSLYLAVQGSHGLLQLMLWGRVLTLKSQTAIDKKSERKKCPNRVNIHTNGTMSKQNKMMTSFALLFTVFYLTIRRETDVGGEDPIKLARLLKFRTLKKQVPLVFFYHN